VRCSLCVVRLFVGRLFVLFVLFVVGGGGGGCALLDLFAVLIVVVVGGGGGGDDDYNDDDDDDDCLSVYTLYSPSPCVCVLAPLCLFASLRPSGLSVSAFL